MTSPYGAPESDAPRPVQVYDEVAPAPSMPFEPPAVDYWDGPAEPSRWYFPDNKQYIEFVPMNHGMRKQFLRKTARSMKVQQGTDQAEISTDSSSDDDALIGISVCGWYVLRGGQMVPFSKGSPGANLEKWLSQANPKLVDDLAKAIRDGNPWLDSEVTAEMIRDEINRLEKRFDTKVAEEAKK